MLHPGAFLVAIDKTALDGEAFGFNPVRHTPICGHADNRLEAKSDVSGPSRIAGYPVTWHTVME